MSPLIPTELVSIPHWGHTLHIPQAPSCSACKWPGRWRHYAHRCQQAGSTPEWQRSGWCCRPSSVALREVLSEQAEDTRIRQLRVCGLDFLFSEKKMKSTRHASSSPGAKLWHSMIIRLREKKQTKKKSCRSTEFVQQWETRSELDRVSVLMLRSRDIQGSVGF